MMTPLLFATILTTAPYQDLTLDDRGTYSFNISIENTNEWGEWTKSTAGSHPGKPGDYVQFIGKAYYGFNDTVLRVQEDGSPGTTRHNDTTHFIASPWYDGKVWIDGYVRVSKTKPIGAWHNEVWPKPAITLRTSGSDIHVTVTGAPCESVVLIGDGNKLYVHASPGEQSRLMITRPTVMVKGDRNSVYGYVQSQLAGVNVDGDDNELIDLTVVIGPNAVGDDVGAVYFRGRGNSGNSATRTRVVCMGREYPPVHGWQAFYFDDRHDGGSLNQCEAVGFMRGIFGHGATNTTIDQFTSRDCETAWLFSPHFTTPRHAPQGNTIKRSIVIESK